MLGLRIALSVAKGVIDEIGGLLSKLARRSTYSENLADSRAVISDIDSYDLLDKATILLTPTATSDARVHSVKTYTGDELVTNGGFDTDSDWTKGSNWSIVNGEAVHTGSGDYIEQGSLTEGTKYKVVIVVTQASGSGFPQIYMGGLTTAMTSPDTYTFYITAQSGDKIKLRGLNDCKVDSISVLDVSSDFNFDRASSATRINSSGLVQDMQSITDPELVLNGDFEELGDELVTNGTFDTDSDWTTLGDWTISGGLANCNGSSIMFTNAGITANKTYKVTYTVSGFVSGGVKIKINGSPDTDGLVRTSNGTYTEYITSSSSVNGNFSFAAVVSFVGSIDNVSVQQVDPNDRWSLGAGWSISDGKLNFDTDIGNDTVSSTNILTVNNIYRMTFDVNITDGVLRLESGDGDNFLISSSGTYTHEFKADLLALKFRRNETPTRGYIDNISVKDITFSTDVDLARINYDSNGANGHILLEPTSTNLITYSEDFSQSAWSKVDVLIEGGYTAPDGSNNAYKVTKNGSNAHLVGFNNQNTSRHKSIWAKTVSGTGDVYLLNQNTNDVFSLTNEWQRFDVAHAGANWFYAVDFRNSALTEVIVWGAQLEALPYATSYIPTLTGSTVTRATETLTGSGNSTLINSTEGVLYAEIAALSNDGTRRRITLSDGTTNNRVNLYFENVSNTIEVFIKGSGGNDTMVYTSSDTTQFHKIAVLYKDGESSLWVDGVERDTSTTTFSLANLSNLDFQQGGLTGDVFYGKCKALAVFNEALSDDELELLTGVTNYGSFGELASANGYTII